jgi:hypothetical protein
MRGTTKQANDNACIRDKIILAFVVDLHLTAKQICHLRLYDIVNVPNEMGGFIEAQHILKIGQTESGLILPKYLRNMIEDYVNTSQPVRPFQDFRPDIGHYLFPSARYTNKGLSTQAIIKIIRRGSLDVLSLENTSNGKDINHNQPCAGNN